MNITTLKKVLPILVEARLCPWLHGTHGKGKSETIETFYEERGWKVFNFRLGTMADTGDLLGISDFVVNDKGEKIATKFCMPDWLMESIEFCKQNPEKRSCIFLDEINHATKDLLGTVFQIALDKRIHNHSFKEYNIDIICASNPDSADYPGVTSIENKALLSRFVHIFFAPTLSEWRDYALDKKYESSIVDFITEQPKFLEEDGEPFSIADKCTPDRRKYAAIDKLLKAGLSKNDFHEVCSGLIGLTATTAFMKYLDRDDKPLSFEDIVEDYKKKAQKKVKKLTKENRTDIIHNATLKITDYFKDANAEFKDDWGHNVLEFMNDIPLDIMFNLAHIIYKDYRFFQYIEKFPENKSKFISRLQKARSKNTTSGTIVEDNIKTDTKTSVV